ncbi:MAG: right-handed parallel beta-helix repeat-containing protein [Flavobacteriales bacterium]|nr:right-handed parallel beta-helix repeat-containing protein [Flavobacteriales bacterium]
MAAHAQDIYLDEIEGDDTYTTNTENTPWKTIAKLNSVYGNGLPSNTNLHLYRGGRFPGQIDIANSAQNVTIQAYPLNGEGARPIVYGSVELAWQQDGTTDVWYAPIPPGITPKYLFANGLLQTPARFPNSGWIRNSNCTSGGGTSTIAGTPFPGTMSDLLGAELVARTYNWQYQLSTVTGVNTSPATVVCSPQVQSMENKDWGFFFQGAQALMDVAGEWCFVDAEDRVYYKTGSLTAPTNVRAAWHSYGVNIKGGAPITSGILVQEVDFANQVEAGIALRGDGLGSHDIEITQCAFHHLKIGIDDKNSIPAPGGNSIHHNSFADVYDRAILHYADASSITDNSFERIGMVPGLGRSGFGGHMGIDVGGDDYEVLRNVFLDIGYAAINAGGTGTIANNYIRHCLAILNDGGGIQFDNSDQLVIRDNVIVDVGDTDVNLVSTAGSNPSGVPYFAYEDISYGIYFGNRSITNATIEGNVVSGCDKGIHVDHTLCSSNEQVLGNTLFNNRVQLSMTDYSNYMNVSPTFCGGDGNNLSTNQGYGPTGDYPNYRASYNDSYANNIAYCLSGAQFCLEQSHVWPGSLAALVNFGSFSGNHYHQPFGPAPFRIGTKYRNANFSNAQFSYALTIPEWQTQHEPGAQGSSYALQDHSVASVGSTVLSVPDPGTETTLWECFGIPGSRSDVGGAMLSQGSPWLERNCSPPTAVGGKYRLNFTLSATENTTLYAGFHYRETFGNQGGRFIQVGTTPTAYSLLVDVDDHPGNDYMYFNIEHGRYGATVQTSGSMTIDDLSVQEVTFDPAYDAQIAANHILRYYANLPGTEADPQNVAATNNGTFIVPEGTAANPACGLWSDVYGTLYAPGQAVTLEPWASIVLFQTGTPPAEFTMDGSNEHHITSGEEIITDHYNVEGSFIVHDEATLTIDGGTLGFKASTPTIPSNVTVLAGGTLNLRNGGQVRNWIGCDGPAQMWDGVRALSYNDPENPPILESYPGQIYMESNGQISNALVGALCGEGDPADPGIANTTPNVYGGVIQTNGAIFRNNRIDAVCKEWVSPEGISSSPPVALPIPAKDRFINTRFITDAVLNDPSLTPRAHILAADVELRVHGCTMTNTRTGFNVSLEMGHGIEAFNAYLKVEPCEGFDCPPGSDLGNIFSNLDHAIHGTNSVGGLYTTIRGNTFIDNICGNYLSGQTGLSITDNTYLMGRWTPVLTHPDEFYWQSRHRAIFTTHANAFSIQDNIINLSPEAIQDPLAEGIVTGYTEDHDDIVFRNQVLNLARAYVAEGLCSYSSEPTAYGLQWQCNLNDDNATNFLVRIAQGGDPFEAQHTVRGRQGSYLYSAGNTIDITGTPVQVQLETNNAAAPLIFYFSSGTAEVTPDLQYVVQIGTQALDVSNNAAPVNDCSVPTAGMIGGGHDLTDLPDLLQTSRTQFGNLRYLFEQLIDAGNTNEVVQEITSTWPQDALELRAYLLSKSPYLSTEALVELVNKYGIPDAIKAEVCIANPDATQKENFLDWAEHDATYPLPAYHIENIRASWDTRTYRTELEMRMADAHTNMVQAANHWVYWLYRDTVPPPPDSVQHVWRKVRTCSARYAEAGLLMAYGKYHEADSIVRALPLERELDPFEYAERSRMLGYIDILKDALDDDRNSYQLTATEITQLKNLIGDVYDRPSAWIRNLLCAAYGDCMPPYTGGGEEVPKATRQFAQDLWTVERPTLFTVMPNPARTWVALNYAGVAAEDGRIVVHDLQGRVVQSTKLNGPVGQVVWDVRGLPAGIYMAELFSAGKLLEAQQVVVQE